MYTLTGDHLKFKNNNYLYTVICIYILSVLLLIISSALEFNNIYTILLTYTALFISMLFLNPFFITITFILLLIITVFNDKIRSSLNIYAAVLVFYGAAMYYIIKLIKDIKKSTVEIQNLEIENNINKNDYDKDIIKKYAFLEQITRLKSLKNIAEEWSGIESLNDLYNKIINKVKEMFSTDRVYIIMESAFSEGNENSKNVYSSISGINGEDLKDQYMHYVYEKKENLFVKDTETEIKFEKKKEKNIGSIIICQITVGQEKIGYLRIESEERNFYQFSSLRIADAISDFTGILVKRIGLMNEIEKLARLDGLTGLFKRWYFSEEMEKEYLMARRYNYRLAYIICDIDFFKKINDTYGHSIGDRVLSRIAGIFKNEVGNLGIHCRYGGEEFVGLFRRMEKEGIIKIAEDLRKKVEERDFSDLGIKENVTISIGYSVFPDDSIDKEKLMKIADDALYSAKETGRNKVCGVKDIDNE